MLYLNHKQLNRTKGNKGCLVELDMLKSSNIMMLVASQYQKNATCIAQSESRKKPTKKQTNKQTVRQTIYGNHMMGFIMW